MTLPASESGEHGTPPDIYDALAAASPRERTEIILHLIRTHPERRLQLPARDKRRAMLDETDLRPTTIESALGHGNATSRTSPGFPGSPLVQADLRGASLHGANLQFADLRAADLRDATLGDANLEGAILEEANLGGADLAGANLRDAALGEVNFEGAMLEDALLQGANLRFAYMRDAILEGADLGRADLWGAVLDGAFLAGADLEGVTFGEATLVGAHLPGANLREAALGRANLQGADLTGAQLEGATLSGTDLRGAKLRDVTLEGVDLTNCKIDHLHLSGAWLEQVRLHKEQLGNALGEELAGDYDGAARGYLALERNFLDIGDPDAAGWAYAKRRRMQKFASLQRAREAQASSNWGTAARAYVAFTGDQTVEWLCDYGESVPRVIASMVAVYVLFMLIYGVTGSVVRSQVMENGEVVEVTTRNLQDLAIFSLLAMTASDAQHLSARAEWVYWLTGTEVLLGIFLTGLLGFVAGNRIRR